MLRSCKFQVATSIITLFLALGLAKAESGDQTERINDYAGLKLPASQIAPDNEDEYRGRTVNTVQPRSLGEVATAVAASAGVPVEWTYDDFQYSQKGRRVDFRLYPDVIFSYTHLATTDLDDRKIGYNKYDPITASWPMGLGVGCTYYISSYPDTGTQFPTVAMAPDARILLAGEVRNDHTGYIIPDNIIWWQFMQNLNCYAQPQRIPTSQYDVPASSMGALLTPIIQIQEYGGDTVMHLVATGRNARLVSGTSNVVEYVVQYFRKTTFDNIADWSGPTIIDSAAWTAEIAASPVSGNVAVVYTHHSSTGYGNDNHRDREVYYRESPDAGLSWSDPRNVTNYDRSNRSYDPWIEVSPLYTTDDELVIVFNAHDLPPDPYSGPSIIFYGLSSSLFAWSSATNQINRIHSFEFTPSEQAAFCGLGGYNTMSIAYFQVSECNGRLYVVFVKWNDPENAPPDDCSPGPNYQSALFGGNGEVYLCVCPDLNAVTWDYPRNLTNTYTPGCAAGDCLSETKISVARYGMDSASYGYDLTWPDNLIDPTGSYSGSRYLHLTYLEDEHPSEAALGAGSWTFSQIKWVRLACVAADNTAELYHWPRGMNAPDTVAHGVQLEKYLILCNDGNWGLTYAISIIQDNGPAEWLRAGSLGGDLPASGADCDSIPIHLNADGVVNSPPGEVALNGRLVIAYGGPASPDTVEVSLIVSGAGPENTPTGTDVVVNPNPDVEITFSTVTNAGNTTVETGGTGPDGPNDFLIIPTSSPVYYNIETTAEFTGTVEICFTYDQADVFGDESLLQMFHYDTLASQWVDITASLDTASNVICGLTTGFSPFALALPDPNPSGCCVGLAGNVDNDVDDIVDIGDLTALIDYLFISYEEPECMDEANTDGAGAVDIGDLTTLIDFLFISYTPVAECP